MSGPPSSNRLAEGTVYMSDGINPYWPPFPSLCTGEGAMREPGDAEMVIWGSLMPLGECRCSGGEGE